MISRRQTSRKGLSSDLLATWDRIAAIALPEAVRDRYEIRELAIQLYATGESLTEIKKQTEISKQQLYKLVERCIALDVNGTQFGFRGLIPSLRICTQNHSSQVKLEAHVPMPGALQALFEKFPAICKSLTGLAVEGKRDGTKIVEKNVPIGSIHKYFIELCTKAGIKGPHYPFSPDSESEGKPAIRRWVKRIRQEHSVVYLRPSGSMDDAKRKNTTGPKDQKSRVRPGFYKQVELDGHKIDAPLDVEVPSPTGEGTVWRKVNRIWIVALVLRKGGACIGYSLATGTNYSGWDVIRATQNSLKPWVPRELTVENVRYRPGDGMPSGVIPELSFACWDETLLDNHMGHRAGYVLSQCERMVQAIPVFSPVASPNTHPWVEGFFNLLEEAGFHRLPMTTGSGPNDVRRKGKRDERYRLTFNQLEDLVDLLVCRINGWRASASSQSKLEVLAHAVVTRGELLRRVPVDERDELFRFDMYEERRIGHDRGKAVIRFAGGRYGNDMLTASSTLIGRSVLVMANSQKLRKAYAVLDDGTQLGELDCEPRYSHTEFSIETIRDIKKLGGDSFVAFCEDIPLAFRRQMEVDALKSAKAARILLRLQREQNERSENDEAPPQDVECVNTNVNSDETDGEDIDEQLRLEAQEILKSINTQYR